MALMMLIAIMFKPTFAYDAPRALPAVNSVGTTTHETSQSSEEPLASWDRISAGEQSIPVDHLDRVVIGESVAAKAGAKSAEQMAKHLDKLGEARNKVAELRRQLETLKGPKAQGPIREQIDDLVDQIRGHEKEIRQKWPELGDAF